MAHTSHGGALTGPLPPDFLVLHTTPLPQMVTPSQPQPQSQQPQQPRVTPNNAPRQEQFEDVRTLQVMIQKAVLKQNHGLMPMSCFTQVSIGQNSLRTRTHNYCGTAPLWDEAVQFGIRNQNPRRVFVEVFSWGVINDDLLAVADIPLDRLYAGNNQTGVIDEWLDLMTPDRREKAGELKLTVSVVVVRRPANEVHGVPQESSEGQRTFEDRIAGFLGLSPAAHAPPAGAMPPPSAGDPSLISPSMQAQMQQAASRNHAQDRAQLKAMFPQFDDDIIASVYAAANADIDTAAAQLLSLDE